LDFAVKAWRDVIDAWQRRRNALPAPFVLAATALVGTGDREPVVTGVTLSMDRSIDGPEQGRTDRSRT
jgi:hypothetical protein